MRHALTEQEIEHTLMIVAAEWRRRLAEKGPGIFVSTHEILGVVEEEHDELKEAVRKKEGFRYELLDNVVACLHGLASYDSGKMEW